MSAVFSPISETQISSDGYGAVLGMWWKRQDKTKSDRQSHLGKMATTLLSVGFLDIVEHKHFMIFVILQGTCCDLPRCPGWSEPALPVAPVRCADVPEDNREMMWETKKSSYSQ